MNTKDSEIFPPELLTLLQTWRTLTDEERGAIECSDWERLSNAQAGKQQLQTKIDAALKEVPALAKASSVNTPPRFLPPEVSELIQRLKQLEVENRELLDRKLSVLRSGMASVNTSVRHLRQVHQAYGQSPSGMWQSYS